jgi:hypothetical protein
MSVEGKKEVIAESEIEVLTEVTERSDGRK